MASMRHLRGVGIIEIVEIVLVLLAAEVCDESVEREQLDDHLRRHGMCGVTLAPHAAPGSWLAQLQLSYSSATCEASDRLGMYPRWSARRPE